MDGEDDQRGVVEGHEEMVTEEGGDLREGKGERGVEVEADGL
jgi:hypothetical protein